MSIELKIKSKHLGLEAKVIRHEERKLKKQIRWQCDHGTPDCKLIEKYQSISNHRKWEVRNENRATFLARAYLSGRPYKSVENKIHDKHVLRFYILPRVFEMVNKYGPVKDRIYKYPQRDTRGNYLGKNYNSDERKAFEDRIWKWIES
jgi:hypothetical protein